MSALLHRTRHRRRPAASSHPAYKSWQQLDQLRKTRGEQLVLKDLFKADGDRFTKYSKQYQAGDDTILLDYSKNLIDEEVLSSLFALAREAKVEEFKKEMFEGKHINTSEDRSVLHIALRNPPVSKGGWDIKEEGATDGVQEVLQHMKEFSDQVRSGEWKGYTGKAIKSVINIGIGGSDLGPVMATEALKFYSKRDLELHFVSNIDGTDIAEVLRLCDPETSLFIVASKTFTTQETITNAETAKEWFLKSAKDVSFVCFLY